MTNSKPSERTTTTPRPPPMPCPYPHVPAPPPGVAPGVAPAAAAAPTRASAFQRKPRPQVSCNQRIAQLEQCRRSVQNAKNSKDERGQRGQDCSALENKVLKCRGAALCPQLQAQWIKCLKRAKAEGRPSICDSEKAGLEACIALKDKEGRGSLDNKRCPG